jgi:hypothetical protein
MPGSPGVKSELVKTKSISCLLLVYESIRVVIMYMNETLSGEREVL